MKILIGFLSIFLFSFCLGCGEQEAARFYFDESGYADFICEKNCDDVCDFKKTVIHLKDDKIQIDWTDRFIGDVVSGKFEIKSILSNCSGSYDGEEIDLQCDNEESVCQPSIFGKGGRDE